MYRVTRRQVLGAVGTGLAVPLAGCGGGEDPEPGLHAINALVIHRQGDDWYDYPEDVGVRVTVENTDVDRHRGTVVTTLRRTDGEDEWTREREVELSGGTTRGLRVVFESVAESGEDSFEATTRMQSSSA